MKKYFFTGLALLLPLALTAVIVVFAINLFTDPFVGFVKNFLAHFDVLQKGFLFLSAEQVQLYASRILILLLLFFTTVFLGWLTQWVVVHYFIRVSDYVFHRIPVISSIYKTSQDVIKTIFGTTTRSFKQVVLVPFPNMETYSVGLVTKEEIPSFQQGKETGLIAVFVPTTPNPTSGFLMMFRPEDIIFLDMKVEDAFKYVISCGVIIPSFNQAPQEVKGKGTHD